MGVEGSMKYVVEKLSETERVFGAENWTNYALEKLRETERDMGPVEWFNCVLEKLKKFLYVLQHLGEIIMRKVDEVFPPETREEQIKHWVQVATPYVITAVVLLILFCCCRGVLLMLIRSCCSCVQMVFRSCCRFVQMLIRFCRRLLCCGRGTVVRNGVKMMKAPGTGGTRKIPRVPFEADPRWYFRGLRGK
ncbi:hypothetical protein Vadar_009482 [Vaccinium darrowii]|uniref:Uncharacterized protein n=1 Tax=Vaccinium darrowii TaxID=229202 RepID=A0ACB7XGF2_9ERIC|nr:hypothetical protein Vadar_009482 [Vaccinium darrowii]